MPASLVDLMFPTPLEPVDHWEAQFPPRDLPEGALVTRFAPSPTGYLHVGGLYTAIVAQDLAHNSGGTYFIRIEDTDGAREDADARRQFAVSFAYFAITSDESADAPWGPYDQSARAPIYESFARELVAKGRAYPCFCTSEELEAMTAKQRAAKVMPGYYGAWATCRQLSAEEGAQRIAGGATFVVRFRAPGGQAGRVTCVDRIRGPLEQIDNRNDAVVLKNSALNPRLPTYHFAHVVDDHLMRVNLVTRGEEWVPSLPLHLQMFAALGFDAPDYAHIAPLMKLEGSSKRKLSKRKDPEASVELYITQGIPAGALRVYLRGLANGNLADIDFAEANATPIALDRMGVAGPVFDPVKLQSISKNYIAEMTPDARLTAIMAWADTHDPELAAILETESDALLSAFTLERQVDKNPRKDLGQWQDVLPAYRAYLNSQFVPADDLGAPEYKGVDPAVIRAFMSDYVATYAHGGDRDGWFDHVRATAARHGFAPTTGDYKRAPDQFTGSIGDASNILRVALTGRQQSPDLYLIAQVVGEAEYRRRLATIAAPPAR